MFCFSCKLKWSNCIGTFVQRRRQRWAAEVIIIHPSLLISLSGLLRYFNQSFPLLCVFSLDLLCVAESCESCFLILICVLFRQFTLLCDLFQVWHYSCCCCWIQWWFLRTGIWCFIVVLYWKNKSFYLRRVTIDCKLHQPTLQIASTYRPNSSAHLVRGICLCWCTFTRICFCLRASLVCSVMFTCWFA